MKNFYKKSIIFWFILLLVALINATIRETTYKPLLVPHIGFWAHQISSLTGIILFFIAIYFFLKKNQKNYSRNDLFKVGILWIFMTIVFESFMNIFIRRLNFQQILQTYYFWKGDTWFFVLLSLMISPFVVHKILNKKNP